MTRKTGLIVDRRTFLAGAASTAAIALYPRTALGQEDWNAVVANAESEGALTFYHNFFPAGTQNIIEAFNQDYPNIRVSEIRLPSAQYYQRFETEYQANRIAADVNVNAMDDVILTWHDNGWIEEWTPPEADSIPPEVRIENSIYGVQAIRHIFAYNSNLVSAEEAPKDWMDIFDPKWRGRLGMYEPWRSVGPQLSLALMEKNFGINTAERFKEQDVSFYSGSAGALQALIRGDVDVCLMADLSLAQALEDGAPIVPVYPESGVAYVTNVAFVTQGATHPNAAKVMANWLLTVRGQEALQTYSGSPGVRADIAAPQYLPANADINAIDGRTILTAEESARIIGEWRTAFGVV